jgi:AraC-like DNA-binding protein
MQLPLDTRREMRAQVTKTWRTVRPVALPFRILREAWPRVLPTCEGGNLEHARSRGENARAWLAAITAFDELALYRDRDTLLRRAVELLRSAIGLERAAIFLLDDTGQQLLGTWGTGIRGQTTDERQIAFEVGSSHREAFLHAHSGNAKWSRFSGVPLFAETENGTVVVRTGENVIIPIPGGSRNLGLVVCDWALSGSQANVETLLRATVLTRVLAPLLLRLEAPRLAAEVDSGRDPGAAVPSPTCVVPDEDDTRLAARAANAIQANPALERAEIAKQLGVSPDRLGRAFKLALGESMADYKNRQRAQRFLAVVDPGGGNLLEAALEAGFGSYAQFHRVFRRLFDCAPIDYLKRRERD